MKNLFLISRTSFIVLFIFSFLVYAACQKDKCKDVQCQNGGTCNEGVCNCPDGYSGTYCEVKAPCTGVVCLNGGTCVDGTCECADGYTGERCEKEKRSAYYKIYRGNGTDDNGYDYIDFHVKISANGKDLKKLNVYMWQPDPRVTEQDTLKGTAIINAEYTAYELEAFTGQNGAITYTGGGTLSEESISLSLRADINAPPFQDALMTFPELVAE